MIEKEQGDRDVHLTRASQSITVARVAGPCGWLAGQLTVGPSPLEGHRIATAFQIELEPSFLACRIRSQPAFL